MKTKAGAAEVKRLSKEMDELNQLASELGKTLATLKSKDRESIQRYIYFYQENRRQWKEKSDQVTALVAMEQMAEAFKE